MAGGPTDTAREQAGSEPTGATLDRVARDQEAEVSWQMTPFQWMVIATCCALNIIDGYAIISLSLVAPSAINEWNIDAATFGIAFSATSAGAAVGAMWLSAERLGIGRRLFVLGLIGTIAASSVAAGLTTSMVDLSLLRAVGGCAFGALLVQLNLYVYEFSGARLRGVMIAALHVSFSAGTILGGFTAALIIEPLGWRAVFYAGGGLSIFMLVLAYLALPESLQDLAERRPANALAAINHLRARMRMSSLSELPEPDSQAVKGGTFTHLFSRAHLASTLSLWWLSFVIAFLLYAIVSWTPKFLVGFGLTPVEASLGVAYSGAACAILALGAGLLIGRLDAWRVTFAFLLLGAAFCMLCGIASSPALLMATLALGTGCIAATYSGSLLMTLAAYDDATRNLGTGAVVALGRIGAVVGPYLGGVAIVASVSQMATFATLSILALSAALVLWLAMPSRRSVR